MRVSRIQILGRGLRNECPNCAAPIRAQAGSRFRVEASCPRCGLVLDQGEGSFLGPVVINYGVTVFGFILPIIILYACKVLSPAVTLALAGGAALFLPILFYRLSWAWWVMLYYFVLTDNLPANRGDRPRDDE
jgi:hypothetical protein